MESEPILISVGKAMEVMSEQDLTSIATHNPVVFKQMCLMLSLEQQLQREGKHPILKDSPFGIRKSQNWFVSLRYKIRAWLFSMFLKMM